MNFNEFEFIVVDVLIEINNVLSAFTVVFDWIIESIQFESIITNKEIKKNSLNKEIYIWYINLNLFFSLNIVIYFSRFILKL